jgi:hypothetical protein
MKLGTDLDKKAVITFLPRVLGHGGFASDEISVSYLDRNYAGNAPQAVVHHELVHLLDARLGGELRPSLLVEGLAVYLTGGHFKSEPLMERAAALLSPQSGCVPAEARLGGNRMAEALPVCAINRYLPLEPLADDFYNAQHEIGYLQAGALVAFMVDTWGWDTFTAFYRDIQPPERDHDSQGFKQSEALELALQKHYGFGLLALEEHFLEALRAQQLDPQWVVDVSASVEFYDTVRRYQRLLDPSAYFLTAWLPGNDQLRQREIVTDYTRRPSEPANLALEALLVQADADLRQGDLFATREILQAVNRVLDAIERGDEQPFTAHALVNDTLQIVESLTTAGYQPHRMEFSGNSARVWVTQDSSELVLLNLTRSGLGWRIAVEGQS